MSKWKVYISSAFRDLKELRSELINLFQNQLQNKFELSRIMERMFDEGTYIPLVNDCIKQVENSDIYIIILGNKVGSFPPGENKTYTEIELDTAIEKRKSIFCLTLENFDDSEIDNKAKHQEILEKFAGRSTHTFKDSKELKSKIYECLYQFAASSPIGKHRKYILIALAIIILAIILVFISNLPIKKHPNVAAKFSSDDTAKSVLSIKGKNINTGTNNGRIGDITIISPKIAPRTLTLKDKKEILAKVPSKDCVIELVYAKADLESVQFARQIGNFLKNKNYKLDDVGGFDIAVVPENRRFYFKGPSLDGEFLSIYIGKQQ